MDIFEVIGGGCPAQIRQKRKTAKRFDRQVSSRWAWSMTCFFGVHKSWIYWGKIPTYCTHFPLLSKYIQFICPGFDAPNPNYIREGTPGILVISDPAQDDVPHSPIHQIKFPTEVDNTSVLPWGSRATGMSGWLWTVHSNSILLLLALFRKCTGAFCLFREGLCWQSMTPGSE